MGEEKKIQLLWMIHMTRHKTEKKISYVEPLEKYSQLFPSLPDLSCLYLEKSSSSSHWSTTNELQLVPPS